MLSGEQDGAAPLAAHREALNESQDHEQDRRPDPDLCVGRQAPHQEGDGPDKQDRELKQLLAAELVAEVSEHHAAQGPRNEADRIGQQCSDQRLGLTCAL